MKRVVVFLVLSMFLFSFVSARLFPFTGDAITSKAVDENNVCCSTLVVVPDSVPSYEWRDAKDCDNLGDRGEELVGASNEIVNDSFCVNDNRDDKEDEIEDEDDEKGDRERAVITTRERIRDGNCTIRVEKEIRIENGERIEIIKRKLRCENKTEVEIKLRIENRTEDGRFREKIRYEAEGEEFEVETEDEIELEEETNGTEYKLKARLRNGNVTHIKIMPDTASDIAIERLKALNFTIQLRERVHENIPEVVYHIEGNKTGRFLGVFKLRLKVEGEIDPETGEFLGTSKPWWAFLVVEQDEVAEEETNTTA